MKESAEELPQTVAKEVKREYVHGLQLMEVVEESCKYLGTTLFCR